MISPTAIERPAWWRPLAVGAVILLGLTPGMPLAWSGLSAGGWSDVGSGLRAALWNSVQVAAAVGVLALLLGLPLGVLAGWYDFPGRRPLLALLALPVLVPSFLWAIGWSALAARVGGGLPAVVSGRTGSCIVFLTAALPIVVFAAVAAAQGATASQIEAARLAGGERAVWRCLVRSATAPAAAAACLASVLTLSDPGPGQILGLRTAAAEVLTSFSALYDFELAARQCLLLSLTVLCVALPVAAIAAPKVGAQLIARQVRPHRPERTGRSPIITACFCGLLLLVLGPPVLGLILPLRDAAHLSRAWGRLTETGLNTLLYGAGAGLVAAALGWALAFAVGRQTALAAFALASCVVVFAQPPALIALGLTRLASDAPAQADPLLRGRLTVVLAFAARLFPIAAVLCLRAWASMPASWAMAAGVHGVGLGRYGVRVLLPRFLPVLGLAALLVGLLATADVGTVLLLHPPGRPSLPLAVFTVMANAPESLVAALCLVYLAAAAVVLWAALLLLGRRA